MSPMVSQSDETSDMARVLVILPTTGYRTSDFVEAATRLGIELAVASDKPPPIDMGERFVQIDPSKTEESAEAIIELATRTPVDSIVAADDTGVVIAAVASERLGLEHNSTGGARATRDKIEMRRRFDENEVPQPPYRVIGVEKAEIDLDFPVVVKPRDRAASQGVVRADDPGQLREAVKRVRRIIEQPDAPLVVESYAEGPEIAIEGLMVDGSLRVLAVFDKPDRPTGPGFEELMLVTPSRHPEEVISEATRVTEAGVVALGLRHGPVHAELILGDHRVLLVEIAARSVGGHCGRALRFGLLGDSLETALLRAALGHPATTTPNLPGASGALMIPIPGRGTLERVDGVEATRDIPGIESVEISLPVGSHIAPPPDGDRYLGFVIARAQIPDEVEQALTRAIETLRVVVS